MSIRPGGAERGNGRATSAAERRRRARRPGLRIADDVRLASEPPESLAFDADIGGDPALMVWSLNSNATAPHRQLPQVVPDVDPIRGGRRVTEASKPNDGGYSSNCGRSSTISCQGAFEPTKKCDFDRAAGLGSTLPDDGYRLFGNRERHDGTATRAKDPPTDRRGPIAAGQGCTAQHPEVIRRRTAIRGERGAVGFCGTSNSGIGPHARRGRLRRSDVTAKAASRVLGPTRVCHHRTPGYAIDGFRSTRPARSPVCSSSARITVPLQTVAL